MDGANIECKANNTLVSKPTVRSLVLDMFCKLLFLLYPSIMLSNSLMILKYRQIYFTGVNSVIQNFTRWFDA